MPGNRPGLTLVELVVALTLGAAALAIAVEITRVTAQTSDTMRASSVALTRSGNARSLLRSFFRRHHAGTGDASYFRGTQTIVHFTSHCEGSVSSSAPCTVRVAASVDPQGLAELSFGPRGRVGTTVTLPIAVRHFLFLASAENGGLWLQEWHSISDAPLAVGAVVEGDTLLFRVGGVR